MNEVKKKILKFNQDRDWDQFHSPENLAKSIAIEAGELLECFQWNNDFNKDDLEYKYSFEKLEAPLKKGTKVGNLSIYYGDYLLYQEEYFNDIMIERDAVSDIKGKIMDFIFPYGLAIFLVVLYFFISKIKKHRKVTVK